MKKIGILVNSASNGGGEKIAVEMANHLSNNSQYLIDLILIEGDVIYDVNEKVRLINLDYYKEKVPFLSRLLSSYKLLSLVTKENYDVVISHLYLSNYLNVIASSFSNYLSIGVTHGSIRKYDGFSVKNIINKLAIKILMKKLDKRVFLTDGMLEDFNDYIPVKNNYVIPNGYSIEKVAELSLLKTENIPFENDDYYCFIGRIHSVKNLHQIIKVCIELNKNLVIVGDGDLLNEMKKISEGHKNIYFCGRLDNPFPILKNSKALILASKSEGFPNVIIEALSLGVTVISSDCRTGPREILRIDQQCEYGEFISNKAGILFRVGDSVALRKIICNMTHLDFDRVLKKEIASIYSLESMCTQYETLFK